MEEQWKPWDIDDRILKKYYIVALVDDTESFKISLVESENSDQKVEVVFDGYVVSYCCSDESFRQKTLDRLDIEYGEDFYANTTFFWIDNSEYLRRMQEEAYGLIMNEMRHFCIMAEDSFVDIITTYEPEIHIL